MSLYAAAVLVLVFGTTGFAANPVASVDFRGGEQGRIQIEVKINDQGPFPFLFDTGSVGILSLDLANQLGLLVSGQETMQAFGGPVTTASAFVSSIKLGSLTMGQSEMTIVGGGPFRKDGLAGILGREFLLKLVTEIDYEHGTLKFFDPETFVYQGHGVRLPLRAHKNDLFSISTRVFGSKANLQVDSGSEAPLVLFPRFVRAHRLSAELNAITGYGFGGLTRATVTRLAVLNIGNLEIKNSIVRLSADTSGLEAGTADGNIGGPLLREFTCLYDLPNRWLYLEPNHWYGQPALQDKSGLVLDTRNNSATVLFVYPGSPAAKAGVVAGDELALSDGHQLTGDQWHDLLDGAEGSVVRVTVKQQAETRSVSFELKSFL